ncbi:hypothetical protein [Caldicellulosiruptor changbaiensis]|nr:hypothetical protein [Caldicellulosiruptor changbaiensis]
MGTVTCSVLVGTSHQNHSGIIPEYILNLWENDKPAWVLRKISQRNDFEDDKKNTTDSTIVWIPTLENMFEDALLMIGIYVIRDKKLVELAEKYFKKDLSKKLMLYGDIDQENLKKLYETCRKITANYKIVVSILDYSSITKEKLRCLQDYSMDVEILKTIYKREFSVWANRQEIRGSLEEL